MERGTAYLAYSVVPTVADTQRASKDVLLIDCGGSTTLFIKPSTLSPEMCGRRQDSTSLSQENENRVFVGLCEE